jgi:hypothetical protein
MFDIKSATRQGVLPLVGFYGRSGSGKTMSALLFARGIVGTKGKIVLIDSENRRGSLFSDVIPSGYSVIDFDSPFTPERYTESIDAAEKGGADCIVIDSLSHEWSGSGGVLDAQESELDRMAGDNWQKRESCKMAAWIKPKSAHKKMVMRLLRCKVALICCLRGEEKTHIIKDDGKTKVITDEFSSPLFDQRFIFELLLNFETISKKGKGGFVIPRKITHPSIAALLPNENQQISVGHGEALAAWCASAGSGGAAQSVKAVSTSAKKATEATRQWMLAQLKDLHVKMQTYAIDKGIIMPNQGLEDWPLESVPTDKDQLAELRKKIESHA